METSGSVTRLIQGAQQGDSVACQGLYEAYFRRLVGLAREKLQGIPRRVADEEDVALSVLDSFLRGAEEGRFPELKDRESLWRLLVMITAGKAADLANYVGRQRRGGAQVLDEAALDAPGGEEEAYFDQVVSREPTPEFAAQMADQLQRLLGCLDKGLRQVAEWKLDGWLNEEIATKLGCVPRTITRKLRVIRSVWEKEGLA